MDSNYDLLDFLASPTEQDIQKFCQLNNFDIEVYKRAYHTGDISAINSLSKALIVDIDNNFQMVTVFHKNTLQQMLYWHNAVGNKNLPDSFFMLLHKAFYPTIKFANTFDGAKKEFFASFSALAQIKEKSGRNVSLIARAYKYASKSTTDETDRKTVRECFEEEKTKLMEAEFLMYPDAAEHTMKIAFNKIRKGKGHITHQGQMDKKLGAAHWLEDNISFEDIYAAVKHIPNY